MAELMITPRVTEYTVCPLPEDHFDASMFTLTVAYRGRGKWAVMRGSRCLGSDGTWDFEPIPSERTDDWLARYRHDEETALRLAVEHVPHMWVNGWTAAAVLEQDEQRRRVSGSTGEQPGSQP